MYAIGPCLHVCPGVKTFRAAKQGLNLARTEACGCLTGNQGPRSETSKQESIPNGRKYGYPPITLRWTSHQSRNVNILLVQ